MAWTFSRFLVIVIGCTGFHLRSWLVILLHTYARFNGALTPVARASTLVWSSHWLRYEGSVQPICTCLHRLYRTRVDKKLPSTSHHSVCPLVLCGWHYIRRRPRFWLRAELIWRVSVYTSFRFSIDSSRRYVPVVYSLKSINSAAR